MSGLNKQGLLTPAMRGVLQAMARAGRAPLHSLTPAQAKAAYAAGAQVLEVPARRMARLEDFSVPARDAYPLPVRLYAPELRSADAPPLPWLVYFHGGGFTIGSPATHDVLCRELSHQAGCAVVSVDYRLAPEHRFPVAVHDAWDALQALVAAAPRLGLNASRVAVGGDSAGGTLAAVCALLARDAGLPLALQLLVYPGCAAQQDSDSHLSFGQGFVLEQSAIQWFFGHYLGQPNEREDWRFAPLNAPDLEAVAPAWLALAECDPLHDEGLLYADRLRASGVAVDLEIYRGVTHEFIKMGRVIPEALRFHVDAGRALRQAFDK
jgi:acetyl esterase